MSTPVSLADPVPLARALIAEPSVTPESAGCFDLLQGWLESLGFTVHQKIFTEPGHPPTENFYARRGASGPNLCFAGHIDVVPPGDPARWTSPPFEPSIRDGHLYGRGAEDMKGAIAAMVAAAARTPDAAGSISLLMTADEEGSGVNGMKKALGWITDTLGERLDYCVVGEPTNPTYLGEMAKIGRRGSLSATLTVTGKQGHIAYPHLAENPITRLIAMLHALKAEPIDTGSEFFPPSNLEVTTIDVANPVDNLIPETAVARMNVRFNDLHDGAGIERWITERCARIGGAYRLDFRLHGESFLSPRGVLSETLSEAVLAVTGHTPELSTTGGSSDARFIRHCCPVIEFGTTGFTPHQIDERVSLDVLEGLTQVYTVFIERLFARLAWLGRLRHG